jgi:hypothetical protein
MDPYSRSVRTLTEVRVRLKEATLTKKGVLVLATNNVDDTSLSSSRSLISTYKVQGSMIEGSPGNQFQAIR